MPNRGNRITLNLEGKVTASRFLDAVNAFIDLIEAVASDMTTQRAVRWIVSVQSGSLALTATPEPVSGHVPSAKIVRTIRAGASLIERRSQRPRHFSDVALESIRDLASVPDGAKIKVNGRSLALSQAAAQHVDALFGATIEDYGSIEGRLQTLSERRGGHFAVYDLLTDQPVRCHIHHDRLDEAWRAFGKRVSVSGRVRYRSDGRPLRISVEDLYIFPDDSTLPTADEVYGILSGVQ